MGRQVQSMDLNAGVNGLMKNGEAGDGQIEARVKEQATNLCRRFPIYS